MGCGVRRWVACSCEAGIFPGCGREVQCGTAEARARRVGVDIEDVPGIIKALVFSQPGQAPVIYVPAEWSGPIREQAIVRQLLILAQRHMTEEWIVSVWTTIVDAARAEPAPRAIHSGFAAD